VIWLSGNNSTSVQYLVNTSYVRLKLKANVDKFVLKNTNLTVNQGFYNMYLQREERKLINYYNMIHMKLKKAIIKSTVGIRKYLHLRGVGYKFTKKQKYISIQIGYSHAINILLPNVMKITLSRKSVRMKLLTTHWSRLTGFLAGIRRNKKPDVYKGKGIRYRRDKVIRKEGKQKKTF
jgi:large subunit ribosomal protein L6